MAAILSIRYMIISYLINIIHADIIKTNVTYIINEHINYMKIVCKCT